ncbi:hypothetical protein BN8_01750 [Fibrisoma limi BUZ 3]|uniref:Uncharacterized protein n=1 Tax=Fibrisoma limi BUZ 3 TaxID=1185876 RepID=I2GFQ4_9BACT|nr:hypothetical protein BN8_01750 [Fibrisoma limi BUZ 3]
MSKRLVSFESFEDDRRAAPFGFEVGIVDASEGIGHY